ncbi:unnamed protein product, partial [marine sediment metagenome]
MDNVLKFLDNVKKKVNYINLNISVEGKNIKIIIYGSKELQFLAC